MTNVSDLIKADHREVEEMFQQFEERPSQDLAIRICDELTIHTEAEEQEVYADLRKVDQELYEDAKEEHDEVAQLIDQVRATDDLDRIKELLSEIQEKVNHHVNDEESEDLPAMEQELGTDRMEELGQRFQTFKEQHQGHDPELIDLTKDELYEKAQEAGLEGRSDMTKEELIAALSTQ